MSERQGMTQQETNSKSNQNSQQKQTEREHKEQTDQGALTRIISDPLSASAGDMLAMQQVLGNRVLRHIIQAKLSVGSAGNHYEQEADRVAEQVIKQTTAAKPSNLNITSKKPSITPFVHSTPAAVTSPDETSTHGFEVAHNWESRLKTSKSTGSPLPDNTRHLMESQLGADFSQVRVHTGFEAGHLNQEINAEAFTHGSDIYMAEGRYQPQSQSGQQLLAHELTHVVQQSAHSDGQQSPTVQRNWLSRLFSRKKKNPESQPAPQPSSTATAPPPPTVKWAGAHSSAASRPARPSIGTSRVPQTDSHYLPGGFAQLGSSSGSDSGTYMTPLAEDHASDSGTYTTPLAEEHASDSGTYTTPLAEEHAPAVSTPAPRAARPDSHYLPGGFAQLGSSSGSDSGTYTTPLAEDHASDSGTYTTPLAEEHAPAVSTPAPRAPRPDSHYLPGGFAQLGSSSGSGSDSGTYTTPLAEEHASDSGTYTTPLAEDHAPGVSTPAPRAPRPDSHYLPGGFAQPASSSDSGSGAYMTPEEHAPVPRSATPPRTAPSPSSSAPAAPAFTMPKLAKFDDETEQQGFWGSRGGAPTYYQPDDQPNPYELEIQDGRFRHKGGDLLDTQNILPYQRLKDKAHRHMFTMGGHGELHSADVGQGMAEHGRVHHTTMSGGRETAAAGELRVNQGKLETVSDASGHYMPGTAQTYQALQHFASRGVDLGATNVELTGKEDDQRALSLSATELMAYKPEMEAALQGAQDYRSSHSLESGDRKHRDKSASRVRGILSAPEEKIRAAHARKDRMLDELRERTAATRQRLDASGPLPQQGRRDLSLFEYEEEMRGYDQASSSQSRRMTPEAAKAAQAELKAHWQEQQEKKKREERY